MKLKGTILLSSVSLLEPLSYYGVRVILILYLTDPYLLNLNQDQIFGYYSNWTLLLICFSIPISFMTDKILGQKSSIYFGGLLCLCGYSLLVVQNLSIIIFGLVLILIGTNLVKPSATILIGRQFKKEDKNRTLAYMIFFYGINIGAFIGSLGLGYIGEEYGWSYSFIIASISVLLYLLIFYFFNSSIIELEKNEISPINFNINLSRTIKILPIILIVHLFFWESQKLITSEYISDLLNSSDILFFGYELRKSMFHSLSIIWTIPLSIGIFIYWYVKGVSNTFTLVRISVFILILGVIATSIVSTVKTDYELELSLIPFGLYALAEILISPLLTSYVTRVSDVKYSNTIYSVFIFLTYLLGIGFAFLLDNEFQNYIVLAVLSLLLIGLIICKNQILKITRGLS